MSNLMNPKSCFTLILSFALATTVFNISACSGKNELEGKTLVTIDNSDSITFLDESRIEVSEEGMTLEGEYEIGDDNRVRLSVSVLGQTMVSYATLNDDGGITVDSGREKERYFDSGDPKISSALIASKTLLTTQAKVCADGLCMHLLVPKNLRPIVISNVSVVGIGGKPIPFSEIEKIELLDPAGSRDKAVKIKVGGNPFSGGWRELRFPRSQDRDQFYATITEAVGKWHDQYGVYPVTFKPLENQSGIVSSNQASKNTKDGDSFIGSWYFEKEDMMISFSRDNTFAMFVNEQAVVAGTYQITKGQFILVMTEIDSGETRRQVGEYQFQDEKLTLSEKGNNALVELSRTSKEPPESFSHLVNAQTVPTAIRDEVSEGMSLASAIKASVSEYYQDRGSMPANLATLGISSEPSGQYVSRLIVKSGSIIITYGNQASESLHGKQMTITPFTNANDDIVWVCGDRPAPRGNTALSKAVKTTVPKEYRPRSCKP